MSYVTKEQIQSARQTDLLSYLQASEPSELVHVSGHVYCTREHDSLKISNGKWYWWSRGFGGVSALDYLIKVKGLSLPQAVRAITGESGLSPPVSYKGEEPAPRKLLLPVKNDSAEYVINYLRGRGIHPEIIRYCMDNLMLYEARGCHFAVFVGYDELGIPRYAAIRSTIDDYKGEATGSDKRYSFGFTEGKNSQHLHLFESAIDLMSYATLLFIKGRDWKQDALLSLAGVFQTKRKNVLPIALKQYLDRHPEIRIIHLHLDNDEVGRGAAEGIRKSLEPRYLVWDDPPELGKDVNDLLMIRLGYKRGKEEMER